MNASSDKLNPSAIDAFHVDYKIDPAFAELIPRRRGLIQTLPLLSIRRAAAVQAAMYERFGFEAYLGCATCEMKYRPIPHAFKVDQTQKLTALYRSWIESVFMRVMPELEAPFQTYDRNSRIGDPIFAIPPNKQDYFDAYFPEILSGDLSRYAQSVYILGVRLQEESKNKVRKMLFLMDGKVVEHDVDASFRIVETEALGSVVGSRTRLVFNPPLPNLPKQVLDTAIHNVYLKYALFSVNMYGSPYTGEGRAYMALDIRHFERYAATCNQVRGERLGGVYAKITALFFSLWILVKDAVSGKPALIKPRRESGWTEQFQSGDSAVTTVAKEIALVVLAQYFLETRHLTREQALTMALNGGDERLVVVTSGDNFFFFGEKEELKDVHDFMNSFFVAEVEDPPKFLGLQFFPNGLSGAGKAKFALTRRSYVLKTYQPERAARPPFRRFPSYGWMKKRQLYEKFGEAGFNTDVFPFENDVLEQIGGLNWSEVITEAIKEQREIGRNTIWQNPHMLLDKRWLLTDQEKLQTGEYIGYKPAQTTPMIKSLLGADWIKHTRL